MSNGKGSTRRPASVPQATFGNNWDRTFTNPDPRQMSLPIDDPLSLEGLEQPDDIQLPPLRGRWINVRSTVA